MSDPTMEYTAAPGHFAHGDNHAQFVRALVKRGVKPEDAEHLVSEIRDNPAGHLPNLVSGLRFARKETDGQAIDDRRP
jgi:hypothetical protein